MSGAIANQFEIVIVTANVQIRALSARLQKWQQGAHIDTQRVVLPAMDAG